MLSKFRSHGRRSTERVGLGALLVLVLALTIPAVADAAYPAAIGRANVNGGGVDQSFITAPASSLAVDSSHIYWLTGSAIGRADLDGTGVDQNFIGNLNVHAPNAGLAVDSQHIYWANGDSIGRANLNGTGVNKHFIDDPDGGITGVAVDSGHVYWQKYTLIGRANINGTGVDPNFINTYLHNSMVFSGGIAVDPAHIYWSYHEEELDIDRSLIGRTNLNGGRYEDEFIFVPTFAYQLAVDPTHIYWANGPTVSRANLQGPQGNTDLIGGSFGASGVAVNSNHVYWTNSARPGIRIGNAKRHRRRGTATLPVTVPGSGEITLDGTGINTVTQTAETGGKYPLAVHATGAKKRKLKHRGSVKVTANVTFTLTGDEPQSESTSLKLIERKPSGGRFDAKAGRYKGSTSLGSDPVHLRVTKDDRVKNPRFELILTSQSSCLTTFAIDGSDKINHHGKFELTDDHGSIQATIAGRFVSRTKVKGRLSGERRGCGSEATPYTVHRVKSG